MTATDQPHDMHRGEGIMGSPTDGRSLFRRVDALRDALEGEPSSATPIDPKTEWESARQDTPSADKGTRPSNPSM